MNIGDKLKKARTARKLRLKDVADATNLSISYISDIEHNKATPPLDTLHNLCNALDISIYSFFPERDSSAMVLMEKNTSEELYELIRDFEEWDDRDKDELISYLKVKKTMREEKK
ncbi:MAG TPA: helix-turn-helix transcriptional regulator [Bacteroidales bacterium]|nr:helix-turn-helix transcriptional regulator [Bacteroidales bacterium]